MCLQGRANFNGTLSTHISALQSRPSLKVKKSAQWCTLCCPVLMERTATCSSQQWSVVVVVVVRLFRDFQIFGFSALLRVSSVCGEQTNHPLLCDQHHTLYLNNLYPIVMTGLVNGVGIMSPMVMEEICNRDIQRGVIETKHVYFRRNAIIRPLQKCDNEKKN